jgi:glycosyltransferase involved in cell wall biosynthesis
MKILFINWSRVEYAGGEKHLLALAKEIKRAGHQTLLICPPSSPLLIKAAEAGVETTDVVLEFFQKKKFWRYAASVWAIYKTIKKFRPDVIHAQGANSLHWLLPVVWFSKTPVGCQLQDFEVSNRFSLWVLRQIPVSFADSDAVREHMISCYGLNLEKCPTIRQSIEPMPGVDPNRIRVLRKEMSLTPGKIAVGICGRIHPNKGQQLFIETAGLLKHEAKLQWFIAGNRETADHRYLEKLDTLIKKTGLESRVRFTGFISNMPEFLEMLDLVVVPSLQEPLGLISVEAQAMQKPVIVSGRGGLPETVQPGVSGIVMEQNTPQCLARHVLSLAEDGRKRRQMGRAGKTFYQRHYTIAENARLILGQYSELTDR